MGPNAQSENIRAGRRSRESAGLKVAGKRGNSRGDKRPYRTNADARGRESRLDRKDHTTEDTGIKPDLVPEWGERRKCSEKLSELRRKLYQKAKREPSVSVQVRSWLLVHACGEICGSAGCGKSARPVRRGRGSWTQQVRPLYSTGFLYR